MAFSRIPAPAKLNLFLHVTGRRADGYHLLESLTCLTGYADRLDIAPADTLELRITGPYAQALPVAQDNLVLRAARLLQAQAHGAPRGASILLHKHIPVGAGLGGGSADAAAALDALARFWDMRLSPEARHAMALSLGSDVPACALGAPGWVTGTGDTVAPVAVPGGWAVLVNPGLPLLTADVFRAFRAPFAASVAPPPPLPDIAALAAWAARQRNVLEDAALSLCPAIGDVLSALAATENCLLPRMSGSGATCFGLYAGAAQARAAAARIRAAHPGWWVQATDWKGTPHGQAQ